MHVILLIGFCLAAIQGFLVSFDQSQLGRIIPDVQPKKGRR